MKRIAFWVLIGAVSLSALLGCIALLSSHFGETEAKVLFSTLAIAQTSLLAMACGAAMGRPEAAGLARAVAHGALLRLARRRADRRWTLGTTSLLAFGLVAMLLVVI